MTQHCFKTLPVEFIERFHSRGQQSHKFTARKKLLQKKRVQLPEDWFGTPILERLSMTFAANGKNETFAVSLQLCVQ